MLRSNFIDLVSAFQLAARCLFSLEEYEDCVTLLGPLIALDDDKAGDDDLFFNCEAAVTRAKSLLNRGILTHLHHPLGQHQVP